MLVEFVSVVDAVRCAVDIQRGMAERNKKARAAGCDEYDRLAHANCLAKIQQFHAIAAEVNRCGV